MNQPVYSLIKMVYNARTGALSVPDDFYNLDPYKSNDDANPYDVDIFVKIFTDDYDIEVTHDDYYGEESNVIINDICVESVDDFCVREFNQQEMNLKQLIGNGNYDIFVDKVEKCVNQSGDDLFRLDLREEEFFKGYDSSYDDDTRDMMRDRAMNCY